VTTPCSLWHFIAQQAPKGALSSHPCCVNGDGTGTKVSVLLHTLLYKIITYLKSEYIKVSLCKKSHFVACVRLDGASHILVLSGLHPPNFVIYLFNVSLRQEDM